MHTVEQLKNGELKGLKRLRLAEQLTQLPPEIITLADSLEILDVSDNLLTDLPQELRRLPKLKVIFASNNRFRHLPSILGQCARLEMVGFKNNQIVDVPNDALPLQLRWLILTDNEINALPESLGHRPRLQKLALAGNRIQTLPNSFDNLVNLELIRLSANQLHAFPDVLLELPKLAWMAFSGNPFCQNSAHTERVPQVTSGCYSLNHVLGQGASGVISHADWSNDHFDFPAHVAIKKFKGAVTSDGYPKDELHACLAAGHHKNLVKSIGQVNEDNYLALVMELIPDSFFNLGQPPTLQTCTRDVFDPDFRLSLPMIERIVTQMLDVFRHLHDNKVCHGDLYAHNVLINAQGDIIFGDFGAASIYGYLTERQQQGIRRVEARALSHFIDDLLSVCIDDDNSTFQHLKNLMQLAQ
ncbi:leucine-rich repeat-containing protein kinase family protein [Vibrio ostreicida]|uniref:Leucine-rich repeat-containing protein kinase family protein n=1 Tax=Vibrio ostreicida TaxID=526588 RepID=A0ABT8C1G6_9VIBR|nr:leucine-rich repeat-containing protein kinase family protein [Vibrio ostreicida]MDN3612188.1 leucine-rich repeat-containing protein kinase family protein [Vibrio ostreicida]NPD08583.1 protein kinase [Vibrio ostreicida]